MSSPFSVDEDVLLPLPLLAAVVDSTKLLWHRLFCVGVVGVFGVNVDDGLESSKLQLALVSSKVILDTHTHTRKTNFDY